MEIWICDDNLQASTQLASIIQEIGNHSHTVSEFTETGQMEEELSKREQPPDLIFMDIDFDDDPLGFESAGRISQIAPELPIIFITAYSDQYAQELLLRFDRPFGYITKPFDPSVVRKYLRKLALRQSDGKNLVVRIKGTDVTIPENAISFMESERHTVHIHTTKGDYRVYEKLSEVADRLSDRFVTCHKSYCINLDYIQNLNADSVVLSTGDRIPVSRAAKSKTREAFYNNLQSKMLDLS